MLEIWFWLANHFWICTSFFWRWLVCFVTGHLDDMVESVWFFRISASVSGNLQTLHSSGFTSNISFSSGTSSNRKPKTGRVRPGAGLRRHAALRGPGGQRAELRDAVHDGAAAPGLCGDQQVVDGAEGGGRGLGLDVDMAWRWLGGEPNWWCFRMWSWVEQMGVWSQMNAAKDQKRRGQECFRAQAQLRQKDKPVRVPYRSSSLTQAANGPDASVGLGI